MKQKMVRAVFRTASVPHLDVPHNIIRAKIYYPALFGDTPMERNTGAIPVDPDFQQMPIVIMTPGMNLDPSAYGWLARALAEKGIVTVVFDVIMDMIPGGINLTPGLDLTLLAPEATEDASPGFAYGPLLEALKAENDEGVFQGQLDLNNIWFGGHSAGGSTALMSASRKWFPGLQGVFLYAAHTGMSTMMGYPQGYIRPIPDIPVLLMGGTRDGCIANSAHRYGDVAGDATGRVMQTFDKGICREVGDSVLAIIEGANHFTIAYPVDDSTGRAFIDYDETCNGDKARQVMSRMIIAFIQKDHALLEHLLSNPMIAEGRMK